MKLRAFQVQVLGLYRPRPIKIKNQASHIVGPRPRAGAPGGVGAGGRHGFRV